MTRYVPQWLQAGSYAGSQDRRLISAIWPAAASSGCAVTSGTGMTVNVAAGQVAVPTQNSSGSTLCSSDASEPVTIAAAPGTNSRIDLVICQPRGNDLDGGANNDFIFTAVTGTVAASPTPPATPAGAVALAQILVPSGSATVAPANITDVRPGGLSTGGSGAGSGPRGWVAQTVGPVSTVSCGATATTIMSLTATLAAGRRYRLSVFAWGAQAGSVGTAFFGLSSTANIDSAQGRLAQITGLAVGSFLVGTAVWTYTPTAASSQTWTLQGTTSAGSLAVSANQCSMLLEDIGSQ